MLVTVNGAEEVLEEGISLLDYVQLKGLIPETLVFLLNDQVLERQAVGTIMLKDKDRLEILRYVGGG
ncbi:MAG: sulfur carrier protein ThiS [Bacillota bacterium]